MNQSKEQIKESTESEVEYWGVSSCINLYDCDLALMQDADAIRQFVVLLCERIKMRRYGETQVVFFGDEPRVQGFSMTQLIETSLISAHFTDASRATLTIRGNIFRDPGRLGFVSHDYIHSTIVVTKFTKQPITSATPWRSAPNPQR